ncbi:WecB/TagA/CpsF family glycosyltransferase [Spirosoma oryzicola]|uniref:WecB/TagA/CpsF family glycosyltransferase n=1 Tax=Spirosoma oryzicola TaxID=2898794 RepID=UPI001E620BBC|nr:WecB/TagA/CpsF family glycosyltransferase [Spirosoma oryzicola]UHG92235.1 WecB/TagA/CpsF family glycosyltransferase [Spirosoma oryzicola]
MENAYSIVPKQLAQALINKVSLIENKATADRLFKSALASRNCTIISFINAHAFNICYRNDQFAEALLKSDWLLRDGKGIEILYKSIGRKPGVNMCGTDTIPQLLTLAKNKRIALIGTEEPYLQQASDFLTQKGSNVVLTAHGFHAIANYLPLIQQARPDVVVLGMGMPKQEQLSIYLKEQLDFPCVIVNGGAIIDYWGNKVVRAPNWVRQVGGEWAFRLLLEPRRLFTRYVIGNFVFLRRVRQIRGQQFAALRNTV